MPEQIRKAIAFSLWGDAPRYTVGMVKNAIIAPHVFEDWQLVVFHDATVPTSILQDLHGMGVVLRDASAFPEKPMFWRFLINDMAERWIVRDADSRLSVRDLAAVEAWVRTGKRWHVIRDDRAHTQPVLGGLWGGFKTGLNMRALLSEWPMKAEYNDDQRWLADRMWEQRIRGDCCVHDSNAGTGIPRDRFGHYFVGQVWDENERRW